MTFLRRMGTKAKIAHEIHPYFPAHEIYIELFFGAGGMFFNKPRARQNFLNDLDDDIFNLYQVAEHRKPELIEAIERMPVSESLFKHWRTTKETDPIRKALRFLFLSNFSYLGAGDTLHIAIGSDSKSQLLHKLNRYIHPEKTYFLNGDFRDVLGKIAGLSEHKKIAFIYADPPYIGTNGNYDAFTKTDTADLFQVLVESGIRFAVSEFDHPFVLEQVEKYGLYLTEIGERQNVKNRRKEYLITNYKPALKQISIFDL